VLHCFTLNNEGSTSRSVVAVADQDSISISMLGVCLELTLFVTRAKAVRVGSVSDSVTVWRPSASWSQFTLHGTSAQRSIFDDWLSICQTTPSGTWNCREISLLRILLIWLSYHSHTTSMMIYKCSFTLTVSRSQRCTSGPNLNDSRTIANWVSLVITRRLAFHDGGSSRRFERITTLRKDG